MSLRDNSRIALGTLFAGVMLAPPVAPQASSPAHDSVPTISPGMTREQVVDHLGWPIAERDELRHSYYFYDPACSTPGCAPNDVVIFRNDSVEDALFHSGLRRYTGQVRQVLLPSVGRARGTAAPSAIQAASAGDSTRRGGVVFVGPRPIGRPTSQYQTIQPAAPSTMQKSRVRPAGPTPAPDSTPSPSDAPAVPSAPPAPPPSPTPAPR